MLLDRSNIWHSHNYDGPRKHGWIYIWHTKNEIKGANYFRNLNILNEEMKVKKNE